MTHKPAVPSHQSWAQLRFAVVGPLLASPPPLGQLHAELARLATRVWQHPISGEPVRFAVSTIERWLYKARAGSDPVGVLRRQPRRDRGEQHAIGTRLSEALWHQYQAHPRWSYQLHLDNLAVLIAEQPELGALPSYASLRRYMVAHGWTRRQRRPRGSPLQAGPATATEIEAREVRSYEASHVGGLWHLDFHHGSRKILSAQGEWFRPLLLAILDDHSRLVCHTQWYRSETAASLIHGLTQAFLKRGLPRALLTDNGSAMIAAETVQGLARLGIVHHTTLPNSPYQNGKQESFWTQAEGRLLAMLEGEPALTLPQLNEATLAWLEIEYHRTVHSETHHTPLARFLDSPAVSRLCPQTADLELAFTAAVSRTQRQSDGTLTLDGVRFEVPARFHHLRRLAVRYRSWDLRQVWLLDETTGVLLDRLFPLDRERNAEGVRRPLAPPSQTPPKTAPAGQTTGIAPLLRKLMADYAATGLPPAYISQEEDA